ncbi:MAG: GNAT family N-acetyltransferase [Dehalococcoidia bacterium]
MDVSIRPYQPGDLETCRELWRELTQRHRDIYDDQTIDGDDPGPAFDEHLARKDIAGVWLAERDGEVLGLCGLLVEGDSGEVEPIVVRATERSNGIGRQLVERTITDARERGVRFLSVQPVARNIEAIAFFYEAGFAMLGHLDLFMELSHPGAREWKPGITIHSHEFTY